MSTPQATDSGLPYTKHAQTTGSGGEKLFLSQEISSCNTNTGSCNLLRSIYRRYTMEWRGCDKVSGDSPGCFSVNPRPVVERTVFHDDQDRWVERRWSDWNGVGRAREEKVVDNFDSNTPRTERTVTAWSSTGGTSLSIHGTTGYLDVGTPSSYLPSLQNPWILHRHDKKTVYASAGGQQVTEVEFNNKGTKTCERRWRLPFSRSSTDLVTQWIPGTAVGVNAGLPTAEIRAGGDAAGLSSAVLCALAGNASNGSRFDLAHTYQDLQLASTQIGSYPFSYRADIDPNTGLVSTYYAVTGQSTAYAYDGLGRLTSATPEASLQEASLNLDYFRSADSPPWMRIRRLEGPNELTREDRYFDALGRLIGETRQWPQADGTVSTAKKEYQFHSDGNLRRETTWQAIPVDRSRSTSYNFYDPFGRAFQVTQPDGQQQTHFYKGARNVKVSFEVEGPSGPTNSWVRTVFDGLGREVATVTPLHRTDQAYGPTGQVISATRHSGGLSQTRKWTLDGRGLLMAERLPEVGSTSGLGAVSYTRDALGQVRSRHDGHTQLTYSYDTGGRPTQLLEGTRPWKEWTWGAANNINTGDYRLGKLVEAVRHNWLDNGAGGFDDWVVRESYEYKGRLGKISARETALESPTTYDPTLRQSWTYDSLGRVKVVQYPECVPDSLGQLPCADGGDVVAQDFSAYWDYLGNQPLKVTLSGSQEPNGLYAEYTYHPNLQPFKVDFQNGTQAIYNQGTAGMARPARLQLARPINGGGSQTLFDTGFYTYDGAGNISAIGNNHYAYDKTSRLLSASINRSDAVFSAAYTYDPFDNLTGYRHDGGAWQSWNVDTKNRQLGKIGEPASHIYDSAGNLVRVGLQADGISPVWEWTYDALNMQQRYKHHLPDGTFREYLYLYGPGDLRLMEFDGVTGLRKMTYRNLSGSILREYEVLGFGLYQNPSNPGEQWTHKKDFLHGPLGLIATRTHGGGARFFFADHLGTPRVLTNGLGTLTGKHHYYPYGAEYAPGQDDEQEYKFTGHQRDTHGLSDYMRGRTCAYPLQRFMSVDPGRDGWNLYAYTRGNPVNLVDPDGMKVEKPKGRRLSKAVATWRSTRGGSEAYRKLEEALGTYRFQRRDSRLTPAERRQLARGQEVTKKGGGFSPDYDTKQGKVTFVSGGTFSVDFYAIDSAGEHPYDGPNGDAAIVAHEVGHGLGYEGAENKKEFLEMDYEIQEERADEHRDAVLEELEDRASEAQRGKQ